MKTLYIEASTEKSVIALISDSLEVNVALDGGPLLSKNLGKILSELLQKHNFKPDRIAIGEGPGSLTGVRVAMAMGQSLAFGWKLPIYTFSSIKAFAPQNDGPFCILIDAKMGGIYLFQATKIQNFLENPYGPVLLQPEEVKEKISKNARILSPTPTSIEKRISTVSEIATPHFTQSSEIYLDLKPIGELR